MLKVSGSGRPLGKCQEIFSADLKLGGDYGTALCAAVAKGREDIVQRLVQQNPDLKITGGWIKAGWEIPLMTIRPIWGCTSCCCDDEKQGDG